MLNIVKFQKQIGFNLLQYIRKSAAILCITIIANWPNGNTLKEYDYSKGTIDDEGN
jgi:hypothetical protein